MTGAGAAFATPDFGAPLDLEARLARAPAGAEVKGFLLEPIAERARRAGASIGRERYLRFRGYPVTEWLELLAAAAAAIHPEVPPREGLRRLGHGAYRGFRQSTVGGVVMGLAGTSLDLAVPLVGRSYEVLRAHGTVRCVEQSKGRAVFEMRGFYDWIDAWHVGVFEGALEAFGARATIRVRMIGDVDGDVEATWAV